MASKSTYNCENCQTRDFIEGYDALVKHLLDEHSIDVAVEKCTRQMLSHLDGATWFASTYKWTFKKDAEQVVITGTIRSERDKHDPMRIG